jgi:tetratricopeptide (TPR) repeat protein
MARPGLSEADRRTVVEVLPAGMAARVTGTSPEEPVPAPPHSVDELQEIIAELEAAAEDIALAPEPTIPEPDLGPAALFGEAEGLREAGRLDEAAAHYYRALELYEKERDALSAIRVVDRLLGLRPDDVVLHHQKTEFAIMTNDRDLLITAYLDLASCLRRQNGHRSARTVFGRILDVDPGNAEARAGIAALDAEELARERQRQSRPRTAAATRPPAPGPEPVVTSASPPGPPAPEEGRGTEFDEMFDDLRQPGGQAEPDYESHYELGVAFRQMQMWDEAAREFKLAVQGMDEPLPAYELLGEALIHLRRYEEARRTLSTAVAQPGEDGSAKAGILFHLGVAHMRAGDPEEAKACLERVVRLDPSRADASQLLSTLSR